MQKTKTIALFGGLDLVSPGVVKAPGSCIGADNYEPERRGYTRRTGQERLDGQPSPSKAAPMKFLYFDDGSTEPSVNDRIDGDGGASGYLYETAVVTSGSWVGNDAAGYLHLRNVEGTFVDNEALDVSAVKFAEADGTQTDPIYESDDAEENTRQAAITQARAQISAITGSGDVLGVFTLDGSVYAFRNNAGGTAAILHKATTTGWSAQTFGSTIDFTSGTAEFLEGETLTGGTSSATSTIERVVLSSGSWGSNATGYLVLSSVSGTFQASETITSASGSATASGAQAVISLPAGGRYRTVLHNFYGTATNRRIYGVNGTGYAFEWDGSVFAPIRTGTTTLLDKPTHVGVLSNHLFLGFDGGSLQFSGTGLPLSFTAVSGAGELTLGQDMTGIVRESQTAMIVTGRNCVAYVTGFDANDFRMQFIAEDAGAISDTLQIARNPLFVDDLGVRRLQPQRGIGDWNMTVLSEKIEPLLVTKRNAGITPVGAMRVRAKEQYRLYFSDGTGLTLYLGREEPEFLPFTLPFTPTCFHSGEDSSGNEILLAGSTAGFIYQLDAGQSDDGVEMEFFIRLAFANLDAVGFEKRWHSALLEVDCDGPQNDLVAHADYAYGDADFSSNVAKNFSVYGEGGFWDSAFWDGFYWDSKAHNQPRIDLQGYGETCSLVIAGSTTYSDPHTWNAITYYWSPRRMKR
jgi:hypothetical protein